MAIKPILATACLVGTIFVFEASTSARAQSAIPTGELQPIVAQPVPLAERPLGYAIRPPRPYPAAYPYAYVYNPRRAYRQAMRYGYPPLFQVWPPVPAVVYPYPHPAYGMPSGQVPPQTAPSAPEPATLEPIPMPSNDTGPREF